MELQGLTESQIRQGATAESFRRGQEYYEGGAVLSMDRRGNVVEAEVEGSQPEPYNVRVEIDEGGIVEAECDCPYSWGGWCKHIVAVLLFCLEQPGEIEERPPLEELLSGLDRDQLQTLLLGLAREEPRLAAVIESRIALVTRTSTPSDSASQDASTVRHTPVDPKPFRRLVRDALSSVDYRRDWDSYSSEVWGAVAEVRRVLEEARAFTRAGDGQSALAILGAITEEYLAGWESLDDSLGESSGLFYDLGRAWTEAFLSVDLSPEEKAEWTAKLEGWQRELGDYGVDETLDPALEAAEQGWDFPPLQRILREGVTELEEPEVEGAIWDSELTSVRLAILDRQGRHQEYLNLARAAGRDREYATMLVRLGRVEEATEYGLRYLSTAEDAEALARVLRERGELERAAEIAQRGLSLEGRKASLAAWLRDLAAGMGRAEQALSAALIAVQEEPSLAAYLRVQELAGERWPMIRDQILTRLRQTMSYYLEGQVDIFLHEGLIDDAIAAVDSGATHRLVERVADAAVESRPDWVIRTCRTQAEPIMDEGRAQYYDAAARWVGKARRAYQVAGREAEWRAYVEDLLAKHRRKYKLMPMLRALAA